MKRMTLFMTSRRVLLRSSILQHGTKCFASSAIRSSRPPATPVLFVAVPAPALRNNNNNNNNKYSFSSVAKSTTDEDDQHQQQQQPKHPHEVLDDCTRKYDAQDPYDAFAILGVKRQFHLDAVELKNKYRRLMNEHHPDRRQYQNGNNNNNHRLSDDDDDNNASIITAAYDRLTKPHTRATHLLELLQGRPRTMQEREATTLNGSSSSKRVNSLDEMGKDLLGMEFLMQIMELRQAVEDAAAKSGKNNKEEALKLLWRDNEQRIADTCQDLAKVFDSLVVAVVEKDTNKYHQLLDQAKQLTAHLQYWYRIQESIREKL